MSERYWLRDVFFLSCVAFGGWSIAQSYSAFRKREFSTAILLNGGGMGMAAFGYKMLVIPYRIKVEKIEN